MSNYFRQIIMNWNDEFEIPLTFTAESAGATVKLSKTGLPTIEGIQYRIGTSGGWSSYTIDTVLTLTNIGDCVQFQNTLETLGKSEDNYTSFVMTGQIAASGNCMSMLNYSNKVSQYAFFKLFNGCSSLTSSPKLPATTLGQWCYQYMFYGCSSLVNAPELPATTLIGACYYNMFTNCSSLVNAPELPATTIDSSCYNSMFKGCSSLVNVPTILPATRLFSYCYQDMFKGCTQLVNAPELPATTLAKSCYQQMFQGCSSLVSAPTILPATTLASNCYQQMFDGCKQLVNAPELHSTTLATNCYQQMFQGCSSLTSAPELPATILAEKCYYGMFYGCGQLVNAPELPATTLATNCYMYMFYGCKQLVNAPELPATTLATNCYSNMFQSCSSLVSAPTILPATTLTENCYSSMFQGCSSLVSAPTILPATTLASYCYYGMFYGCTQLVNAPELPATVLKRRCYESMFKGCSSLVNAPTILPATKLSSYCYQQMFQDCSSLKSAPELPNVSPINSTNDHCTKMFYKCSNLNYIKVGFSSWIIDNTDWVAEVSSTGEFDAPVDLPAIYGTSNIPTGWTLTNRTSSIKAENQNMKFFTIIESSNKIQYIVYPPDSIMTFSLAENTSLPAGLELNASTGEISGISTASEGVYETKIKLSAPNCEDVIITLTITISSVITTPHNLTSNTSDPRYEVSQSTNFDSNKRFAWNAMDGSLLEETGCSHTQQESMQWWKIKFNDGPVLVKKVTWINRTGGIGSNLATRYNLQGSNDGSSWNNVYSITDMVSDSEAVRSWNIEGTTKYQYWRIFQPSFGQLIIGELEFEYSL